MGKPKKMADAAPVDDDDALFQQRAVELKGARRPRARRRPSYRRFRRFYLSFSAPHSPRRAAVAESRRASRRRPPRATTTIGAPIAARARTARAPSRATIARAFPRRVAAVDGGWIEIVAAARRVDADAAHFFATAFNGFCRSRFSRHPSPDLDPPFHSTSLLAPKKQTKARSCSPRASTKRPPRRTTRASSSSTAHPRWPRISTRRAARASSTSGSTPTPSRTRRAR